MPNHESQPVVLSPQPTLPANSLGLSLSPTCNHPPPAKRLGRSWSVNGLEEYIKQHSAALPGLLASSSRAQTKQKLNAQRAAIRSAASKVVKRRDSRAEISAAGRNQSFQNHGQTDNSPFYPEGQASQTQPFASGPMNTIPEEPQRTISPSGPVNKHRATPENERSTIYLIRTDLRYSPAHDTVVASLELPGLRLEDVQLRLGSRSSGIRHLIVTAHSRRPARVTGEVAMQERIYGTFTRTLIVPPHVMAGDIQAEMRDGLLILRIPGTKFEDVAITQTKRDPDARTKPEILG